MTLLNELNSSSLDAGYALAARRRESGGPRSSRTLGVAAIALVAIAVGLASSAAALSLHQPTAAAQQARELLEQRIVARNDEVAALQAELTDLGAQISTLQQSLVGTGGGDLQQLASAGTVEAGLAPVSGSGLRIQLSDAPEADEQDDDSRVQDVDLQIVVNGLWASGAEAIAINGQRVAATTAIRSAGSAVLVDLVPLSGPYKVDAIGDPVALQTGLAQDTAGQLLSALSSTYGIGVDISRQDSLALPGTASSTLRYAAVPKGQLPDALRPTPSPAPSPTSTRGLSSSSKRQQASSQGTAASDAGTQAARAGLADSVDASRVEVSSDDDGVAGSPVHTRDGEGQQ